MIRKCKEELQSWGLKINVEKTECISVDRSFQNFRLDKQDIKTCHTFKYLESTIRSNRFYI